MSNPKLDAGSLFQAPATFVLQRVYGRLALVQIAPQWLLLLGFCVFALAPLTAPGYFIYGHDARHSVYFLKMFDMSVQDGAWYPRWATDMVFGYGYPLWLILAPIPFFAGEAFHLIGFDFVSSVKLVDGLAFFFSAVTMYLLAARIMTKNAALVAAVAYVYIPYHLVDLYVRSAQAELVAFVFPPLVFWAFYQLATTRQRRYIAVAALAYAGLLLSHIQSAVLFTPIIGLYLVMLALVVAPGGFEGRPQTEDHRPPLAQLLVRLASKPTPQAKEKHSPYFTIQFASYAVVAIGLALGIAAVFILPVLAEQRFLTSEPLIGGQFNFRQHFMSASQLLSPFWGYGYAGENGNDQFSLQLGLVPVLLSVLCLFGWNKMRTPAREHVAFFLLISILIVLAVLPISAPVWETFSALVAYVQFPWRLLSITTFALAFLAGAAIYAFANNADDLLHALAVIVVLVVASYPYTQPQHTLAEFDYKSQMEFEVRDRELLGDTVWMTGARPKDSPLVAQYTSGEPLQKAVALDDGASVQMLRHAGQSDRVQVESSDGTDVMFYTRYFPGWTATLDGQAVPIEPYGEQGLMLVRVPAGRHVLELVFRDTPVRQIGAILSLISFVIALLLLRVRREPSAGLAAQERY